MKKAAASLLLAAILVFAAASASFAAAGYEGPPVPVLTEYVVILHAPYLADLQRDINAHRNLGWRLKGEVREVLGEATQVIIWPADMGTTPVLP